MEPGIVSILNYDMQQSSADTHLTVLKAGSFLEEVLNLDPHLDKGISMSAFYLGAQDYTGLEFVFLHVHTAFPWHASLACPGDT